MPIQTNHNLPGAPGQNHDQGPEPQEPVAKKPGFLSRLFAKSSSTPTPIQHQKPAEQHPKTVDQDWRPIDLSHGIFRDKELIGPRRGFEAHLRTDLKKDLGTILNASQRQGVADELAKLRSRGLGRGEVRKTLKRMVEQGSLSKFEAKKLRREFKATKGSSWL